VRRVGGPARGYLRSDDRCNELAGIEWRSVAGKIIRIVQSKGRKDRHVMLPAEVLKLLRQWWKVRPTAYNNGVADEHRWQGPPSSLIQLRIPGTHGDARDTRPDSDMAKQRRVF
jgi:integrase